MSKAVSPDGLPLPAARLHICWQAWSQTVTAMPAARYACINRMYKYVSADSDGKLQGKLAVLLVLNKSAEKAVSDKLCPQSANGSLIVLPKLTISIAVKRGLHTAWQLPASCCAMLCRACGTLEAADAATELLQDLLAAMSFCSSAM